MMPDEFSDPAVVDYETLSAIIDEAGTDHEDFVAAMHEDMKAVLLAMRYSETHVEVIAYTVVGEDAVLCPDLFVTREQWTSWPKFALEH